MLKVLENGTAPTRATKHSAAVDLYASEDVTISAGETKIIGLGVCIRDDLEDFINENVIGYPVHSFMKSHYLELHPRSGLRAKGLNAGVGVIDMDYKDEIKLIVHNPFTLKTVINVAIDYANRTIEALGNISFRFDKVKIEKEGFNIDGSYSFYKKNKEENIEASKIAQILLKEHKTYLLGIESERERTGGLGSTGK